MRCLASCGFEIVRDHDRYVVPEISIILVFGFIVCCTPLSLYGYIFGVHGSAYPKKWPISNVLRDVPPGTWPFSEITHT